MTIWRDGGRQRLAATAVPKPLESYRNGTAHYGAVPFRGGLLRGMSAKQIARVLGISDGTVKSHTVAVFRALNVSSRAQVVLEAHRRGIPFGS